MTRKAWHVVTAVFALSGAGIPVTLQCTDVNGNLRGDWILCIASQRLLNNNLVSAPGCGQVGRYGIGCQDGVSTGVAEAERAPSSWGRVKARTWR